ncbi:hypothetical protein BD560DRAFT_494179 [Blakeslea trispora]|nr:hypothetical protein BD560DRAFT_494179 [Blakeslea trispora]
MNEKQINDTIFKQAQQQANDYTKVYTSKFRKRDGKMWYDPDTNGWCGYCALAYGSGDDKELADRLGATTRLLLLRTFLEQQNKLSSFFFSEDFDSVQRALTMKPDNSTDWWFVAPDMVWLAVLSFQMSIVQQVGQNHILYQHPHSPQPAFVLHFSEDPGHVTCYRCDDDHNIKTLPHPYQNNMGNRLMQIIRLKQYNLKEVLKCLLIIKRNGKNTGQW